MSLFENAIRSIQIGLNDYQYHDRLVSSVRNLYAGILLLFKYKLFLMSGTETNAALIKQNIVPVLDAYGVVIWKGIGNKTIDVAGIKSRFKSLGISVEWDVFDRISKHRNEVEHFYSHLSEQETSELLADCFIIISKFLSTHLKMDAKKVLGEETWQLLLDAYAVYEHEIEQNSLAISTLVFHHDIIKEIFLNFSCISCSSHLVQPTKLGIDADNSIFCCAECNDKYTYDDICNMGIPDLYIDTFQAGLKESRFPFANCDSCEQGLLLKDFQVCTTCGCIN